MPVCEETLIEKQNKQREVDSQLRAAKQLVVYLRGKQRKIDKEIKELQK